MKKGLTTILFLISITCFSQKISKKTHYYFQHNQITKAQFESLDNRKIYTRIIENDSSIVENIYLHKKTGKLDSIQLHQITVFLTKIIGSEFNPEKKQ